MYLFTRKREFSYREKKKLFKFFFNSDNFSIVLKFFKTALFFPCIESRQVYPLGHPPKSNSNKSELKVMSMSKWLQDLKLIPISKLC